MSTDDPTTPAFWDIRFREKCTPWDAGATPRDLERFLTGETETGRVLIPGCGSAYEVRSFAEKGCDVVAIDFSQAAVDRAKQELPEWQQTVILGDFFSYDFGAKPFDLIYERAFLASLPPTMRAGYAARVAELLPPGAKLVGFFVYGDREGGPPFLLKQGELQSLLGNVFEKIAESDVVDSVPVFAGRERWEIWQRRYERGQSRFLVKS
jgi:hypothetical protein